MNAVQIKTTTAPVFTETSDIEKKLKGVQITNSLQIVNKLKTVGEKEEAGGGVSPKASVSWILML